MSRSPSPENARGHSHPAGDPNAPTCLPPIHLEIFVISLREDQHRREEMRRQFSPIYDEFKIIDGLRLSDKHSLPDVHGQQTYDPTLTTAELGCALSHVKALEQFLQSSATHALILEDDVIGSATDIAEIANALQELPNDAFLLCGGQDGLRGEAYNYGKPTIIKDIFKIPRIARKFYTRACCYCVTKPAAARIVAMQKSKLTLSDTWEHYFNDWGNFFFTKKIAHPTDLAGSNIERERAKNTPQSELSRIRKDGIRKIIRRFLSKAILRAFPHQLGLVRIE